MQRSDPQAARLLNAIDRVEILSELVHDDQHVMDMDKFDALMTPYYPALQRFYRDLRKDDSDNIVGVEVQITEEEAVFTVRPDKGEPKEFRYPNSPAEE